MFLVPSSGLHSGFLLFDILSSASLLSPTVSSASLTLCCHPCPPLSQRHCLSLCNSLPHFLLSPYHALFKLHLHTSLRGPSPFLCQWLNSCISLGHFSHILPTPSGLSAWTSSPLNEDGKGKLNFFAQWMVLTDDTTNHLSINLACKEIEKEDNYVFNSSLSFPRALGSLQLLFFFLSFIKLNIFSFLMFTYPSARIPFHMPHQMLFPLRLVSELVKTCYCFHLQISCNTNALSWIRDFSRSCVTQGNLL